MAEWIPVKERLPEIPKDSCWSARVLCCTALGEMFVSEYAEFFDDDCGEWPGAPWWLELKDKVTHWMPLPEPPKEG